MSGCCRRKAVRPCFESSPTGPIWCIGFPTRFGLGYGLSTADMPLGPNPRTCYWGGWGGSIVVVDLDARMVVAYVMNKMQQGTVGDQRGHSMVSAAYAALASG